LHGREEEANEQADDRDHDEQLDERERRGVPGRGSAATSREISVREISVREILLREILVRGWGDGAWDRCHDASTGADQRARVVHATECRRENG